MQISTKAIKGNGNGKEFKVKNIKSILLATTFLLPLPLHSNSLTDNFELAKKCHQLSKELHSLEKIETFEFCKDQIHSASVYSEMAGKDLIRKETYTAKIEIKLAISALDYSTLEDCVQATNIRVAKNELQKIQDALF